jgi:Clp amino terminal domain, pathogenicity island component
MFERYTERARRTLFFARHQASERGALAIETSHVALALAWIGEPITQVLGTVSVSPDDWRIATERELPQPSAAGTDPRPDIPLAATVKHVLNVAREEADALEHRHIGPEHLLLGLIRDGAAPWLVEKGLTLDRSRAVIRRLGADGRLEPAPLMTPMTPPTAPPSRPARPDDPPSYTVHISPARTAAGTESYRAPDSWALYGFTVTGVLAELFALDEGRIQLPSAMVDQRVDIVLVLPQVESDQLIRRLLVEALERHAQVQFALEPQLIDVYVVTSLRAAPSRGGIGAFSVAFDGEDPGAMEVVMRQLQAIIAAMPRVLHRGLAEAIVARTHDVSEEMLRRITGEMGIAVRKDRREVLVLVGQQRS